MLYASSPLALIQAAICPLHLAITIALVFLILAYVGVAASPNKHPVSLLFVVKIVSFVLIAWLRPLCALPATLSMFETLTELSHVERPVFPSVLALAIWFPLLVLACVRVTVFEDVCALAVL